MDFGVGKAKSVRVRMRKVFGEEEEEEGGVRIQGKV